MAKKNLQAKVSAAELEQFEHFLFEMDEVLEDFIASASQSGFHLDYSIGSLASLETLLLSDSANEKGSHLQNRASRYLGEVFRKHVGGKWTLCLKGPRYLFFKLPVISGYSNTSIEFCPIEIVSNFMLKRQAGLFKRVIESHAEFKA